MAIYRANDDNQAYKFIEFIYKWNKNQRNREQRINKVNEFQIVRKRRNIFGKKPKTQKARFSKKHH